MSAIPLFDLMAAHADVASNDERLGRLAHNIVAEAIGRFEQTAALDKDCSSSPRLPPGRDVAVLLRSMYEEDVQYADRVFLRIEKIAGAGLAIAGMDRLKDLYGRTKARLSVSLEAIDEAKEQIRQGRFYTGAQIRDEFQRQMLVAGATRTQPIAD